MIQTGLQTGRNMLRPSSQDDLLSGATGAIKAVVVPNDRVGTLTNSVFGFGRSAVHPARATSQRPARTTIPLWIVARVKQLEGLSTAERKKYRSRAVVLVHNSAAG